MVTLKRKELDLYNWMLESMCTLVVLPSEDMDREKRVAALGHCRPACRVCS